MTPHQRRMIHRGAFRPYTFWVHRYYQEASVARDRVVRRRGGRNSVLRIKACHPIPCPPWQEIHTEIVGVLNLFGELR